MNHPTPECSHFGKCGGCSLQHLDKQAYDDFKLSFLLKQIENIGVDKSIIAPMVYIGKGKRRRAEFKIAVNKGNIEAGFFAAKSHDVVDVSECPVSDGRLVKILPDLREMIRGLKKPGNIKAVNVTALDAGLDIVVDLRGDIKNSDCDKLISFAENNNIVRLSRQIDKEKPECMYDNGNALIKFADINVELPAGAFLQATYEGQMAITHLVTGHLAACERIVDLYSGCGTFSFPLIKQAKSVSSFEGDEDMVLAMHNAIVKNGLADKMKASVRDLFRRPLKEYELNRFDGLVINPPRNGALPQVKNIGNSDIKKIVMVSCNPDTFCRDAKSLITSGYKLISVVPIDQFYWSGHLEVVGLFEKSAGC